MSRVIDVKCPSGMSGEVRSLTVDEANMMAQATKRKAQSVIENVMTACWTKMFDSGPYDFGEESEKTKPDWKQVLMGDAQYLLIKIRECTHGALYKFKHQCTEQSCREVFWWGVDLVEDLELQMLHPDDLELFKAGNKFSVVIDGRTFNYCLPTGAVAARSEKRRLQSKHELVTHSLRSRITGIEGIEGANIKKYISSMELAEAMLLIDVFDEHDCGVETEIEIQCDDCGNIMEVELPFVGEFFYPTGKASRNGRRMERLNTSPDS